MDGTNIHFSYSCMSSLYLFYSVILIIFTLLQNIKIKVYYPINNTKLEDNFIKF